MVLNYLHTLTYCPGTIYCWLTLTLNYNLTHTLTLVLSCMILPHNYSSPTHSYPSQPRMCPHLTRRYPH